MQQLTNEEIKTVCFLYYNQRVLKFSDSAPATQLVNEFMMGRWNSNCRLWLKPLSEISDEDAEGLGKANGSVTSNNKIVGQSIAHWLHKNGKTMHLTVEGFQYLIKQGYAVLLFFGINHWANGKTAIELGIAIEK